MRFHKNGGGNGTVIGALSNATKAPVLLAANTVEAAAGIGSNVVKGTREVVKSGIEIAKTGARTGEIAAQSVEVSAQATKNLIKSAQGITESLSEHTKELTNVALDTTEEALGVGKEAARAVQQSLSAVANSSKNITQKGLNIGKHGLNAASSVAEGISKLASIGSQQFIKRNLESKNRTEAFRKTSEERIEKQKQNLIRQYQLNKAKKNIANQIARQKLNYQQKLKEQQHALNLLKLNKNSKVKTRSFYLNQIDTVKNISKIVSISLEQLKGLICSGKYFDFSSSCKRIKNFNGNSFKAKIEGIKNTYNSFCENIIRKLYGKLESYIIQNKLDVFSAYYSEQVELLVGINNKILDNINNIISIINQNEISAENKTQITGTFIKFGNLIRKNARNSSSNINTKFNSYKPTNSDKSNQVERTLSNNNSGKIVSNTPINNQVEIIVSNTPRNNQV